jgi:methionyl aminopeptidase
VGGVHGDLSEMVLVGEVDEAGRALVRDTHDAWLAAIAACGPGVPYAEIGRVIEAYLDPMGRYSIVKGFCGHGIGRVFHEPPNVLHYRTPLGSGARMQLGHCFTIEPMINEGQRNNGCLEWDDGWTVTTVDGRRSAQFEHTLMVTEDGVDVLTARTSNSEAFWWEAEPAPAAAR